MNAEHACRITYSLLDKIRVIDMRANRLSRADAYVEICHVEGWLQPFSTWNSTFEEVAVSRGVSDMSFHKCS